MNEHRETEEYLRFLQSKGQITHVISAASPDMSPLVLTQKALDAGIAFPIPLPDGSIAVNMREGLRDDLADFGLVAASVGAEPSLEAKPEANETPEAAGGDPDPSTSGQRLSNIDTLLTALERSISEAADSDPHSIASRRAGRIEQEEPEAERPNAHSSEAEAEPLLLTEPAPAPEYDSPEGHEAEQPVATDEPVETYTDPADAGPLPVRSEDAPCEPVASDSLHPAEAHIGEPAGAANPPVVEDIEIDAGRKEDPPVDGIDAIIARLDTLESKVEDVRRMMDAPKPEIDFTIQQSLERMEADLEAALSRPLPRPDATEINRAMARMTTAFAAATKRLDVTTDRLEGLSRNEAGQTRDLHAAVESGMAGMAQAIATIGERISVSEAQQRQCDEGTLRRIIAMQQAIVEQIAIIKDSPPVSGPALDEFLLDLRQTIAELIADRERTALAG